MIIKKTNKKGFTLVELIVVLAILGILSVIAVPKFTGVKEDAKWRADLATAFNLGKAGEAYMIINEDVTGDITVNLIENEYIIGKTEDGNVDYDNIEGTDLDAQYLDTYFRILIKDGEIIVKYDKQVENKDIILYPKKNASDKPSKK